MLEFKKQISVTVDDYVQFNKSHNAKIKIMPWIIWGFVLFITVMTYILGSKAELKYDSTAFHIFLFVFIFILISAIIWAVYFLSKIILSGCNLLFYRWSYKRLVKFKETELLINERGIQSRNDKDCFSVVWDQIQKIVENEHAFYFYHIKNAAFILPKRYIGSLDELYELKEFLKEMQIRQVVTDYN